jgi:hypothetical protein
MQRFPKHETLEEYIGKFGIYPKRLHHPMLSLPEAITVQKGKHLKFVQRGGGIVGFRMAIEKLAQNATTMAAILIEVDSIGASEGKYAETLVRSDAQALDKDVLVQMVVEGIGALQVSQIPHSLILILTALPSPESSTGSKGKSPVSAVLPRFRCCPQNFPLSFGFMGGADESASAASRFLGTANRWVVVKWSASSGFSEMVFCAEQS